jgi:hypothetical protein
VRRWTADCADLLESTALIGMQQQQGQPNAVHGYFALVKAAAPVRRNFTLSIARDDRQRKMIDTGTRC